MLSVTLNLALETWLAAATVAAAASPACRAAAAVRQQLAITDEMGPTRVEITDEMGPDQLPMDKFSALEGCCESLLQTYHSVACVLAPSVGILQAAFPAAPSALRLSLAILQTYDRLQAPWQ